MFGQSGPVAVASNSAGVMVEEVRGHGHRARHVSFRARRRSIPFRPSVERLESLELLTLVPLTGTYYQHTGTSPAPNDYAVFDTNSALFSVAPTVGAFSSTPFNVQIGNPTHQNVPLVGSYVPKTFSPSSYLSDFAIYDKNTSTFYVASNVGAGSSGSIAVQLGDPTHQNIPLVGDYFGKLGAYQGLDDFAVYDVNAATFYVANGESPSTRIAVQIGDPSHGINLTPLVGNYVYKNTNSPALSDFTIYDHVSDTFYVAPNNAPSGKRLTFQFGTPTHATVPLVGTYFSKSAPFDQLSDFVIYDAYGSTFFAAENIGGAIGAVQTVPVGNRFDNNVPLVGVYFNKQFPVQFVPDFAVFDQTTDTFYATSNTGSSYPSNKYVRVQIGDPTHVPTVPIVGSFSTGQYNYISAFAVYDEVAAVFYVAPNDQTYPNRLVKPLGNRNDH